MKKAIIALLFGILSCSHPPRSISPQLVGQPLPTFNILLMDSTTQLNTASIPQGEPIIMFYFSPNCPYCRAQTRDMINHIEMLKNTRIYFLSSSPYSMIKKYYNYFQLQKYPNITVGRDYDAYSIKYFQLKGLPCTAVYGKNKALKSVISGMVNNRNILDIALN